MVLILFFILRLHCIYICTLEISIKEVQKAQTIMDSYGMKKRKWTLKETTNSHDQCNPARQ